MAQYCWDCFNNLIENSLTLDDVILEYDICDNCKQNLPCILGVKKEVIDDD